MSANNEPQPGQTGWTVKPEDFLGQSPSMSDNATRIVNHKSREYAESTQRQRQAFDELVRGKEEYDTPSASYERAFDTDNLFESEVYKRKVKGKDGEAKEIPESYSRRYYKFSDNSVAQTRLARYGSRVGIWKQRTLSDVAEELKGLDAGSADPRDEFTFDGTSNELNKETQKEEKMWETGASVLVMHPDSPDFIIWLPDQLGNASIFDDNGFDLSRHDGSLSIGFLANGRIPIKLKYSTGYGYTEDLLSEIEIRSDLSIPGKTYVNFPVLRGHTTSNTKVNSQTHKYDFDFEDPSESFEAGRTYRYKKGSEFGQDLQITVRDDRSVDITFYSDDEFEEPDFIVSIPGNQLKENVTDHKGNKTSRFLFEDEVIPDRLRKGSVAEPIPEDEMWLRADYLKLLNIQVKPVMFSPGGRVNNESENDA